MARLTKADFELIAKMNDEVLARAEEEFQENPPTNLSEAQERISHIQAHSNLKSKLEEKTTGE